METSPTAFSVASPRKPAIPAQELASELNGVADLDGSEPVVMLVDDDADIASMYAIGLEAGGFRTVVLSDVSSLFVALDEADPPDVLVLDFQLGGIVTGVDILENLRLDDRTADLPVLLLSNHVGDLDGALDRAHAAGARGWHVKSRTSPAQLALKISEICRRQGDSVESSTPKADASIAHPQSPL